MSHRLNHEAVNRAEKVGSYNSYRSLKVPVPVLDDYRCEHCTMHRRSFPSRRAFKAHVTACGG